MPVLTHVSMPPTLQAPEPTHSALGPNASRQMPGSWQQIGHCPARSSTQNPLQQILPVAVQPGPCTSCSGAVPQTPAVQVATLHVGGVGHWLALQHARQTPCPLSTQQFGVGLEHPGVDPVQHDAFGMHWVPHCLVPVGHPQSPSSLQVVVPAGQQTLLPVVVLVQQTVAQFGPVVPLIPV